jgi:hypothetical protein
VKVTKEVNKALDAGAVVTALGGISLAALTALLAWYNAAGWAGRGLPLLGALAITTEAIAFLMAVCAELAWGRGGHWAVRGLRMACCVAILIGCETFNAAGSHEAWTQTMAERAETLVAPQRAAIAAEEQRLNAAITEAQRQIDAIPAPDLSGGPLNDAQAIAAWEALTGAARTAKANAEAALNEMDREIQMPAEPFSTEAVWAFLSFLGFVKTSGLWAIGVAMFRKDEQPKQISGDNVVQLPVGEARKEAVRALRAAGVSFGEIERTYGVRKGTAYRWCK